MAHQFAKPQGWLGRWMLRRMNRSHSTVTDWGLSHIEIPLNGRILDVGCGGGRTIGKLAARSERARVYGLDHSPESVAMASQLNAALIEAGRVEIVEGSVSELPYANDTFDLVTAVETHFFWPDLDGDVREVLRVVKPGGVFAVIAEVYKGSAAPMSKLMEKQAPKTGLRLLTAEEHIDMLWNAGFADVKAFTVPEKGWICTTGRKAVAESAVHSS
jgi:ubiquinone/menaquinone biosynthesis C-methylase UbiE